MAEVSIVPKPLQSQNNRGNGKRVKLDTNNCNEMFTAFRSTPTLKAINLSSLPSIQTLGGDASFPSYKLFRCALVALQAKVQVSIP